MAILKFSFPVCIVPYFKKIASVLRCFYPKKDLATQKINRITRNPIPYKIKNPNIDLSCLSLVKIKTPAKIVASMAIILYSNELIFLFYQLLSLIYYYFNKSSSSADNSADLLSNICSF